jgi:hemolysin D
MATRYIKEETEFLPAVLEIQESPPLPASRYILWAIKLFFTLAVVWACVGEVDVVAVAHGKIVPSGKVKVIQPLEIGVVRRILVEDGQKVNAGQILIELDSTFSGADRDRLRQEQVTALLDKARIEALLRAIESTREAPVAAVDDTEISFELVVPQETDVQAARLERAQLEREFQGYQARISELVQEFDQHAAERETVLSRIEQIEAILPLLSERVQAHAKLMEAKLAARAEWLVLEQERINQVKELDVLRDQLAVSEAAMAANTQKRKALQAQYQRELLAELNEIESRLAAYQLELIKAEQRNEIQTLRAPVEGIVQQLAVHTVGGVATAAQELMRIVPVDTELEAEAWIENKDIGFVEEGQPVEVKLEAFPFTRYGTIDAVITHLSQDAVPDERLGLLYAARVALAQSAIKVDGKLVNLSPGMAMTVEVKTGKRRLIEYLLSPLLRYKDESARER